jgi:hypothetical protein
MRRTSELIDAVKGALSGATMEPSAELALAQDVVRACADTRERLVRAIDLMRQGLRGEAMVIVDVRPVLTETAAALSDPVMSRWRKRCTERGLPVPQPIDAELVHELSEGVAEAEDPRVDQLMRRLRYQNLAHAPAFERLRTMWALRRVDPASVREEDVRAFEQAALKELMDRLREAVAADDPVAACAARDELRRPDWSDRDIAARRATAETECGALEARHAARRGARELEALESSVMRGDVVAAREILDRYESVVMEVHALGGHMPDETRSRAEPLAQWVSEREEANARERNDRDAVERLQALALSGSASVAELEKALLQCDGAGLAVPEAVRTSVERRISAERRRSARVRAAVVASAVLAVAAMAAGGAWWAVLLQREADVAKLVSGAESALERGDIDAAERMIVEASESAQWIREHESVGGVRARAAAERAERERKDRAFEDALAAAGDPRAEGARAALGESALKAARTPDQRARAEQWITSQAAERMRRQRAVDDAFMGEVERLSDRLRAVEGSGTGQDEELARISTEAERLSRGSAAGPDAQLAMQRLMSRIGMQKDMMARERTMRAAEDRESRALAQVVERAPDSLAAALGEFVRDYPDATRTPDFSSALLREGAWRDAMSLPEISGRASRSLDSGDPAERARAADALDRTMGASPESPWMQGLRSAQELCMPQDRWVRMLEDLITVYPVARLRMVELKDGTRHYYEPTAKAPTDAAGGKRLYTVMVSAQGRTQSIALDAAEIAYDGPSPQATVFEQVRPLIRGGRASASVSTLLSVIDRIRSSADMDPVLQAMLIERILEEGAAGAPHLAQPMGDAVAALRRLQLGTVEWIAPGKPSSRPESREAAGVVKQAVDVASWQRRHERRIADVRKWMGETRIQPVGMIDRVGDGPTRALISAKAVRKPPYKLYAVMEGPGGPLRVREIGAVSADGSAAVDRASESLPAGTLLFGGTVETMPEPLGP